MLVFKNSALAENWNANVPSCKCNSWHGFHIVKPDSFFTSEQILNVRYSPKSLLIYQFVFVTCWQQR